LSTTILDKYEAFNPINPKDISKKKLRIDPCLEFLKELNEKSASAISEVYPELKNLICFDDTDLGEYSISEEVMLKQMSFVYVNINKDGGEPKYLPLNNDHEDLVPALYLLL
jgi:hypothetical protein